MSTEIVEPILLSFISENRLIFNNKCTVSPVLPEWELCPTYGNSLGMGGVEKARIAPFNTYNRMVFSPHPERLCPTLPRASAYSEPGFF